MEFKGSKVQGKIVNKKDTSLNSLQSHAVPVFVGTSAYGPLDLTEFKTLDEAYKAYGGHHANATLYKYVERFFKEASPIKPTKCYGVKLVHYTDVTDPATATDVVSEITADDTNVAPFARFKFQGKEAGTWPVRFRVTLEAPDDGDADRFNIIVLDTVDGGFRKWANVSCLLSDTENYWLTKFNDEFNGHDFVEGVDLSDVLVDTPVLADYTLAGGDDGVTSLDSDDVKGYTDEAGTNITGIRYVDRGEDVTAIAYPEALDIASITEIKNYIEVVRESTIFMPIADLSASATPAATKTLMQGTYNEFSFNLAYFWPWLKIANPDTNVYTSDADGNINYDPTAHVLGRYVRLDRELLNGTSENAAGLINGLLQDPDIKGVTRIEANYKKVTDALFPYNVNCLIFDSDAESTVIEGEKLMDMTGNIDWVANLRTLIRLEREIGAVLNRNIRHKTISTNDLKQIELDIEDIVDVYRDDGFFASTKPSEAYIVDVGEDLNPPNLLREGRLTADVQVALGDPALFITLRVARMK